MLKLLSLTLLLSLMLCSVIRPSFSLLAMALSPPALPLMLPSARCCSLPIFMPVVLAANSVENTLHRRIRS